MAAMPDAPGGILREAPRLAVAALFIGLAVRQAAFVNAHAVNVLFWDQWDFYKPLFNDESWWATFARQHGPHREGLGLVIARLAAGLSGWNSRWDAFIVCAAMIGSAAMALCLATRFGVSNRSVLLAAIPMLFMNAHAYEIYVGAVNLSYAGGPIALFMAYCLAWFIPGRVWRLSVVAALSFLLTFTGFGLFVGLLSPVLLALESVQAWRANERRHAASAAVALALACLALGLFARGYTFQPAVAGFRFPYEHPAEYLVFVARMLAHFYGTPLLSTGELLLGLGLACALVAIGAWNGLRCVTRGVEREPRSVVLFCLAAYSLLFCANCSIGRVFTGSLAPYASRYVALLIPSALALYLQAASLGARRPFFWAALCYTVLLVPGTAFPRSYEVWGANWYTQGKRAWKAEYLKSHDKAEADKVANFPIYPGALDDRLRYLEQRRLNLFLPQPAP